MKFCWRSNEMYLQRRHFPTIRRHLYFINNEAVKNVENYCGGKTCLVPEELAESESGGGGLEVGGSVAPLLDHGLLHLEKELYYYIET